MQIVNLKKKLEVFMLSAVKVIFLDAIRIGNQGKYCHQHCLRETFLVTIVCEWLLRSPDPNAVFVWLMLCVPMLIRQLCIKSL